MTNWQEIFETIPVGTGEENFIGLFMYDFLKDLGFGKTDCNKDKRFKGVSNGVIPDFTCSSERFQEKPYLVIECKAVQPQLFSNAVCEVQEQLLISKAKFGLAINGIQCQLWQRHGNVCVPRTRIKELNISSINAIIQEIKQHLDTPQRALTAMLWNNKGGVGKTTLTANIATVLASDFNKKVLLINFDFQGDLNVIMGFNRMEDHNPSTTLLDVLNDAMVGLGKYSLKSLIRSLSFDRRRRFLKAADTISLDIIPGDKSMKEFEKMESNSSQNMSLINSLRQSGLLADYDYIFIDSAPQWEPIGRIAAHTTDIIFPIVDNSIFATNAVIRIKNFLLMEKSFNDPLYDHAMMPTLGKIILNCRSSDRQGAEAEGRKIQERLQSENLPCEVVVMRNSGHIPNAISKGIPVVISRLNGEETKNIKQITESLLINT